MNTIAFIVKSGIRQKVRFYEELESFKRLQLFENVVVKETRYARHAIEIGKEQALSGVKVIVAVGGDGTINEIVNGVLSVENEIERLPDFAVLPYGTANDFARGWKLDQDISQLAHFIQHDKIRPIDVGLCEFIDEESRAHQRYFINMIDAGIGAVVVKKINASNKPLGAQFAFMKAITESFLTYTPTEIYCKSGNEVIEEKILTMAIANGPYFGNGMCIAPDAKFDDGYFSVTCIFDISVKDYLLNIRKLYKKEQIKHPKVKYFKTTEIEISPKKFSCALEGDGEFFGYAPLKIKLLRNKINFLAEDKTCVSDQ